MLDPDLTETSMSSCSASSFWARLPGNLHETTHARPPCAYAPVARRGAGDPVSGTPGGRGLTVGWRYAAPAPLPVTGRAGAIPACVRRVR